MLMLALAPLCCGCLEATSLDEYGYVLTIGVDQGEQKKYNISFLLQKEGDSQEAQTGAGSYIITAEGDNLFDVLTVVHVGVPYELNFTRTNFILLSDQIASSSRMDEFLSISFNALKLRACICGYSERCKKAIQPFSDVPAGRHDSDDKLHNISGGGWKRPV